jgi:hypothetical protein
MLLSEVEQARAELRRAQEQQALEQRKWARRVAEATQLLHDALRANRAGGAGEAENVASGPAVNVSAVDETPVDPLAAVRDAASAATVAGCTSLGAIQYAALEGVQRARREERRARAVDELRAAIVGPNGRPGPPLYQAFAERAYVKAVELAREGLLS